MKVCVNREWHELNEGEPVIVLLSKLGMESRKGFAVAVNTEVIPRTRWSEFVLHDEDEIIIIGAAQGG